MSPHVPLCRRTLLGPALLQRRPRSERPEHLLQQRDIARRRPVLAQKVCQFGAKQRFNGGQFSAAVQHPGAGQDHSVRPVAPGLPGCEARRCGVIFVRPLCRGRIARHPRHESDIGLGHFGPGMAGEMGAKIRSKFGMERGERHTVQEVARSDVVARTQVVLVIGCSTSDLDT